MNDDMSFREKLKTLSFLPTKTKGKTVIERDNTIATKVDTFDNRQDVTIMPKTIRKGSNG